MSSSSGRFSLPRGCPEPRGEPLQPRPPPPPLPMFSETAGNRDHRLAGEEQLSHFLSFLFHPRLQDPASVCRSGVQASEKTGDSAITHRWAIWWAPFLQGQSLLEQVEPTLPGMAGWDLWRHSSHSLKPRQKSTIWAKSVLIIESRALLLGVGRGGGKFKYTMFPPVPGVPLSKPPP